MCRAVYARNIIIFCICVGVASGIAFWSQEGSPFFPTVISRLGILGILSMILGGMAVASSPGRMVSRGEISRTHVHDLRTMRQGYNSWFGGGVLLFLSGIILVCSSCLHVEEKSTHAIQAPKNHGKNYLLRILVLIILESLYVSEKIPR